MPTNYPTAAHRWMGEPKELTNTWSKFVKLYCSQSKDVAIGLQAFTQPAIVLGRRLAIVSEPKLGVDGRAEVQEVLLVPKDEAEAMKDL